MRVNVGQQKRLDFRVYLGAWIPLAPQGLSGIVRAKQNRKAKFSRVV